MKLFYRLHNTKPFAISVDNVNIPAHGYMDVTFVTEAMYEIPGISVESLEGASGLAATSEVIGNTKVHLRVAATDVDAVIQPTPPTPEVYELNSFDDLDVATTDFQKDSVGYVALTLNGNTVVADSYSITPAFTDGDSDFNTATGEFVISELEVEGAYIIGATVGSVEVAQTTINVLPAN